MPRRRKVKFQLEYAPAVLDHMQAIERKYHSRIRREIERRLCWDADEESRNRKPLVRPSGLEGTWEWRFGPLNRFRVFYELRPGRVVRVLAVGEKWRNQLRVGGEVFRI